MSLNNYDDIKQRVQDYKTCFSTESGKRVLRDLEKRCFYNSTIYNQDEKMMYINEGARCMYLHIIGIMNTDIEKVKDRIKELTEE